MEKMADAKESLLARSRIEQACKQGKYLGNYSFVPIGLEWLSSIIDEGEKQGYLRKWQTVLDMGSGDGRASIFWAHRGYNVIGIELQQQLVRIAEIAAYTCKDMIPKGIELKMHPGNYLPESYHNKRLSGNSSAVWVENMISRSGDPGDYFLFPPFTEDVYKKNSIDIKGIDVFYAYAWPTQVPSVIEIFSDNAHDDATLCISAPMIDEAKDYIKKLKLIEYKQPGNTWDRYIRKAPVQKEHSLNTTIDS